MMILATNWANAALMALVSIMLVFVMLVLLIFVLKLFGVIFREKQSAVASTASAGASDLTFTTSRRPIPGRGTPGWNARYYAARRTDLLLFFNL